VGADMEKLIGTVRFILVYFPSGIMGFILGANFAGNGIASTGCSGALFGIIALVLLVLRSYPIHLYYSN
jgi:membrane associated rhomboid family serine protease